MPWRFVLFEFYDPIYEELDNPSSELSDVTRWTEQTRAYMNTLVEAERSIMAPLYDGRPRHWQGNKLGVFLPSVIYRIIDNKKLQLPWFGYSAGWESATTIRVCGRLGEKTPVKSFETLLAEWSNWLALTGQGPTLGDLVFKNREFNILCEFPTACGDQCMALYTAMVARHRDSRVDAAGFFSPEQSDVRYLRIGQPGEITAHV